MAIYEILVRGKPDGTLPAAHAKDYVAAGIDGAGETSWVAGPARPIRPEDLSALVSAQFAAAIPQAAQAAAVESERDALRAELRELKGVPQFVASDLIRQFTDHDMDAIDAAVTGAHPDAPKWKGLHRQLQQRIEPIPIDGETFLVGLAGLQQALGDERVKALFAAMNIDIVSRSYIK